MSATCDDSKLVPTTTDRALVVRRAATATSATATAACAARSQRPDDHLAVKPRRSTREATPPATLNAGTTLNRMPAATDAATTVTMISGVRLKSKYLGWPSSSTA